MLVGRAGRAGDLPLPAQPGRHRSSRRRRAAVAGRRVRRHVPARLQPQQPVADGADHRDRLRGRRRHRDDREHRPLHRAGRRRRWRAALEGAAEIGFTILSLTVSLIAVLIPLLFMGDVVGRLFREFAITLGVTILLSAVVSLTLTPMMCARLLRHTPRERQGRFYRASRARSSIASSRSTARTLALGARRGSARPCWSPSACCVLTDRALHRRAEGLLPGAGHRRHPRHLRSAAVDLVPGHGGAAAGAGRGHPARSGGREPVVLHRHRRHQHHPQQRPHADQPEAARPSAASSASEVIAPPAAGAGRGRRASVCSCSRCRTSPSRTASAARSTSTASRTPTPTS